MGPKEKYQALEKLASFSEAEATHLSPLAQALRAAWLEIKKK